MHAVPGHHSLQRRAVLVLFLWVHRQIPRRSVALHRTFGLLPYHYISKLWEIDVYFTNKLKILMLMCHLWPLSTQCLLFQGWQLIKRKASTKSPNKFSIKSTLFSKKLHFFVIVMLLLGQNRDNILPFINIFVFSWSKLSVSWRLPPRETQVHDNRTGCSKWIVVVCWQVAVLKLPLLLKRCPFCRGNSFLCRGFQTYFKHRGFCRWMTFPLCVFTFSPADICWRKRSLLSALNYQRAFGEENTTCGSCACCLCYRMAI